MTASVPLRLLHLCFIVLFGAMSLMHGPVMAFGAGHEPVAQSQTYDHGHDHGPDHDHHHGPQKPHSSDTGMCNAFACFLAVAPVSPTARPIHAILIGALTLTAQSRPQPTPQRPAIPPPRIQG